MISTHAPRTGSDSQRLCARRLQSVFQPTLPARGATSPSIRSLSQFANFNPRSPHGERHGGGCRAICCRYFNPRSPHGERPLPDERWTATSQFQPTLPARGATCKCGFKGFCVMLFQPTLPARGATSGKHGELGLEGISTHAPRTGSDRSCRADRRGWKDFNPRSPHGERPLSAASQSMRNFNPRSPHGERRHNDKKLF